MALIVAFLFILDLLLGLGSPSKTHAQIVRFERTGTGQHSPTSRLEHYMMGLYRVMSTEDQLRSSVLSLEDHDLHSFDSVISMVAKRCLQSGKRWSLAFDTSSLSLSEHVQQAELRVKLPAFSNSSNALVDIFEINKDRCSGSDCPVVGSLLGHFRAHPRSMASSWKVFNVTKMVQRWLQQQPNTMQNKTEVQEEEGVQHNTVDRVILVVFSRQNTVDKQVSTLIQTAERFEQMGQKRLKNRKEKKPGKEKRRRLPRGVEKDMGLPCNKVDMWVDFQDIGWSQWIIHPKRYNAYRCGGECPTPINDTFTPTNHAYVQSLLKYHHPKKVPNVFCVPTRMSSLSTLYFENGKIVMRIHDNMVVEECGCH